MGSSVAGAPHVCAGRASARASWRCGARVGVCQEKVPAWAGGGGAACLWDFLGRQDLLLRGGGYSLKLCHLLPSQLPAKHNPESPSPPPPQLMTAAPPGWNLPLQFSPQPLSFRVGEDREGAPADSTWCTEVAPPLPPHLNQIQNLKVNPAALEELVGLLPQHYHKSDFLVLTPNSWSRHEPLRSNRLQGSSSPGVSTSSPLPSSLSTRYAQPPHRSPYFYSVPTPAPAYVETRMCPMGSPALQELPPSLGGTEPPPHHGAEGALSAPCGCCDLWGAGVLLVLGVPRF